MNNEERIKWIEERINSISAGLFIIAMLIIFMGMLGLSDLGNTMNLVSRVTIGLLGLAVFILSVEMRKATQEKD